MWHDIVSLESSLTVCYKVDHKVVIWPRNPNLRYSKSMFTQKPEPVHILPLLKQPKCVSMNDVTITWLEFMIRMTHWHGKWATNRANHMDQSQSQQHYTA